MPLLRSSRLSRRTKRHRGGDFELARAFEQFGEKSELRASRAARPRRCVAAENRPASCGVRADICVSGLSGGGTIERRLGDFLVADRNVEARAEFAQFLFVQLFLLMRNVAAFAGFAQAVALDGLGENDRRLAFVFHGGFVGGINFARVVTAAQQLVNLLVGQMIHQLRAARDICRRNVCACSCRARRNISGNRRPPLLPCA